jgi:hypothetical protein
MYHLCKWNQCYCLVNETKTNIFDIIMILFCSLPKWNGEIIELIESCFINVVDKPNNLVNSYFTFKSTYVQTRAVKLFADAYAEQLFILDFAVRCTDNFHAQLNRMCKLDRDHVHTGKKLKRLYSIAPLFIKCIKQLFGLLKNAFKDDIKSSSDVSTMIPESDLEQSDDDMTIDFDSDEDF